MKKILGLITLTLGLSLQADMSISVPYKNTFMVYSSSILTVSPVKSILVYGYVERTVTNKEKNDEKQETSQRHIEGDYSGGMSGEVEEKHVEGDYSGGMMEEETKIESKKINTVNNSGNVKYVLSQKNIIQNVCSENYCVIVDNMMNKYVFDYKNIESYKFVTNN